jgi:hypothetical protein
MNKQERDEAKKILEAIESSLDDAYYRAQRLPPHISRPILYDLFHFDPGESRIPDRGLINQVRERLYDIKISEIHEEVKTRADNYKHDGLDPVEHGIWDLYETLMESAEKSRDMPMPEPLR